MLGSVLASGMGRLLDALLAAKAAALPAGIVLAGALITTATQASVPAPAAPTPPRPAAAAPGAPAAARPDADVSGWSQSPVEGGTTAVACDLDPKTAAAARDEIKSAFARYHAGLEAVRGQHPGTKSQDAITGADAMLTQISTEAEPLLALAVPSTCADPADVAQRAVTAMETMYVLALSAVADAEATPPPVAVRPAAALTAPKPAPKPTPKPTPKPQQKQQPKAPAAHVEWTPKPPRCDDQVYAAKRTLQSTFDRVHGANDQLYYQVKRWSDQTAVAAVRQADITLHTLYDRSKASILAAGCNVGALELATNVGTTMEQVHNAARAAVAAAIERGREHD